MLVGAPYDGPDHRGAIYVYLGSSIRRTNANKIEWKYAQVWTKQVEMEPFRDKYIARYCEDKALIHYSNLQKILGKDVDSGIRTFGWSLSGGMDLDGNKYPDVLVGAYESSNAVYIRSAPVVHLDSKVHNRNTSKSMT